MSAQYYPITAEEFNSFLAPLGFVKVQPPDLPGCKEAVYAKIIGPRLCLRVFSGIVAGESRGCGDDAIRVAIVYKDKDTDKIVPVGKQKRTHRVLGWKKNLLSRIEEATSRFHEICHCGRPMVIRENSKTHNKFWGCVGYNVKKCSGTKPFAE